MAPRTASSAALATILAVIAGCGGGTREAVTPRPEAAEADGGTTDAATESPASPPAAEALEPPTTIASADVSGRTLLQDATRLYFAGRPLAEADGVYRGPEGDVVWSVEKRGGNPTALFGSPAGPIADLALSGGELFFSVGGTLVLSARGEATSTDYREGRLMRVATSGGKVEVVASGQVEPGAVTAGDGQVFWFVDGDGSPGTAAVRRVAAGGGKARQLVGGATAPGALALSGEHLLWISAGTDPDRGATSHVWRVDLDGGAETRLATLDGEPRAIVADGETAFVATSAIIARVPIGGGDPAIIVDGSRQPRALAVDADMLYWTSRETGEVLAVPRQGGAVVTIARNQDEAGGIAADDRAIYWTASGAIRRLRKQGADDPSTRIADDKAPPKPSAEAGGTKDPGELPEKWLKCKRHKQCALLETGCCRKVSVNKRFKAKARKALPRSKCDAECSYGNVSARCEDARCRAVLTPAPAE